MCVCVCVCVCWGEGGGCSPKRKGKPNDNENNIRTNVGGRKQLLGRAEDLGRREKGKEEGGGLLVLLNISSLAFTTYT